MRNIPRTRSLIIKLKKCQVGCIQYVSQATRDANAVNYYVCYSLTKLRTSVDLNPLARFASCDVALSSMSKTSSLRLYAFNYTDYLVSPETDFFFRFSFRFLKVLLLPVCVLDSSSRVG